MSKSKKRKKLIGEKTHSNSPSGESSDEMSVGSQSTLFQDTEDIKSNDFYAPYRVNDYLRRYPEDITGNEYIVFVESTEETPIGTRDMMYLNNCFTRFIKGIKYLKKINKYKVGIIFEKPSLANAFLDNVTFLKQQKLRALIPANTTEITGVITDVPIDMSNKKIFRALSSSKKIICVRRIMRKVKIEDKFENQPTKTVAITFAASAVLPDAVCLKMWRLPVIPYIAPVKQCFNCLRYGHLAKFCKNAVCCSICTERHNFRSCVTPVQNAKCINCGETWLRPHHKFNIKGYDEKNDIIRNDSGNAHNGVAIIILKSLCYTLINTAFDDSIQNVAISVQIYDENITIVSCYSPGNTMTRFYKDKFDNLIESLQQPLIIAGDFNAYHTAWGCDTTNSRGKDILDSIDEHNLIILNNGQFTTVGTHLWKQNALDLTIVSSSLALRCDWCVFTEDSLGSYHLPTITNISFEKPIINSEKIKIDAHPNLKLIDWELFEKSVNTSLNSYEINKNDPLESYNIFCSVIKNTIKDCSVVKSKKQNCNRCDSSKKNFVPWWNANCSKALEECKKAYIIFKRDPSLQNYIYFKKLQAKKKLILRQEQLNSWKSFCNSINRVTPMSKIWDMMKRFNRTYTRSNKFNCDNWIDNFLNKYTPAHVDNIVVFDHSHSTDDNSYLTRPFTMDELKPALSSRKDTAVGMDRLSYKMFKLLNDHNLNKFLNILNLLWHHSLIPSDWKIDCIVPVLKPNKQKYLPDSYRPITLISCAGKIFEQLLKQRLEFYIESNHILPSNQFGFRRGRSARESIAHLYLDIQNALNNNKFVACIFFDIVGAFNNVNLSILVSILHRLNIPMKFTQWIYNFLNERQVYVKFNNSLFGPRLSYKGVCQGGILSPLLFVLYISQLNLVLSSNVVNLQFADDLAIYCVGSNLKEIIYNLNKNLVKLENHFDFLNLDVNIDKSKVVVFSRKSVKASQVKIFYNAKTLPLDISAKFLGVMFRQNFNFNQYVDCLANRASKASNILKSLAPTSWGADPKILLILYKSYVRSHFEYAFFSFCFKHKGCQYFRKNTE
ncbi:unnamed protein product [Euphydryas editha]|uniref:Reverse transcriptase domain-containing protein n=1 Tax=Euphydryas editha TaxID=104508 RepID=A0AAU9VFH1_EUPED|nr:unnamed protein product [Euphydryas editha]